MFGKNNGVTAADLEVYFLEILNTGKLIKFDDKKIKPDKKLLGIFVDQFKRRYEAITTNLEEYYKTAEYLASLHRDKDASVRERMLKEHFSDSLLTSFEVIDNELNKLIRFKDKQQNRDKAILIAHCLGQFLALIDHGICRGFDKAKEKRLFNVLYSIKDKMNSLGLKVRKGFIAKRLINIYRKHKDLGDYERKLIAEIAALMGV